MQTANNACSHGLLSDSRKCTLRNLDTELYIGYYVHCSYDDILSMYRFYRDKNCIAEELKNLAHSMQSTISTNVPMADFMRDEWEKFNNTL